MDSQEEKCCMCAKRKKERSPEEYRKLEEALKKEQFRRYLWQCETLWLRKGK